MGAFKNSLKGENNKMSERGGTNLHTPIAAVFLYAVLPPEDEGQTWQDAASCFRFLVCLLGQLPSEGAFRTNPDSDESKQFEVQHSHICLSEGELNLCC